ncbi:MAG: SUMF1/EgtB/PvdO family nonheme iron enzyme [Chloroflexota bacterium]
MSINFVPQIRVFLASPGDVNEERAIALQVLKMLEYDPLFRQDGAGGVSLYPVAWDAPGGGTPMRVTITPQTAIRKGLPTPSECDIVIVLFWGRMGTPLAHDEYQKEDGSAYLSGTEWEYWDAVNAERKNNKPITLLYRRTEEPVYERSDREATKQHHKVLDFFKQFRSSDGSLSGGVNEYSNPEDFRLELLTHLRSILNDLLKDEHIYVPELFVPVPSLWTGSPFPGLRPFTEEDAPIFFGRGLEVTQLVKVIEANRFVAVVAASGSGKSSLVAAGLIPRLKANAIVNERVGSADWRFAKLTPSEYENPIEGLFHALNKAFPEHKVSPMMIVNEKKSFVESVSENPQSLVEICDALITEADAPAWTEILLFIDQFEELFTLVSTTDRETLLAVLNTVSLSTRLRCIITMRSDFYADCLEFPMLAELLKKGTYPLTMPTAGALIEMIEMPASRAGLTWDDGLPGKIQSDTGTSAGALALMAYALDELYLNISNDQHLTFVAYEALGGVEGAIGKRAESTYDNLILDDKEAILQQVFRELIAVDERGTATRQRTNLSKFNIAQQQLITAFVTARLLVTHEAMVEVAHEAIFRSWERLVEWIESAQEDLILLRQLRTATAEWMRQKQSDAFLWTHERLESVYTMLRRLHPDLSETEKEFIKPEQERLYSLLNDQIDHRQRRQISFRLDSIGDTRNGVGIRDGLPNIEWLEVPGSNKLVYDFKDHNKKVYAQKIVPNFYIAKFPVTFCQFQLFVDTDYKNPAWWSDSPDTLLALDINQHIAGDFYPRDNVSWYHCVAYTRWLDNQLRQHKLLPNMNLEVRLPTEWEWQWVAMNGSNEDEYPWGFWDAQFANTLEAGLSMSIGVGMYPSNASKYGALDLSGNVREWCLFKCDDRKLSIRELIDEGEGALRGGSYASDKRAASSMQPAHIQLDRVDYANGFRVVLSQSIDFLSMS